MPRTPILIPLLLSLGTVAPAFAQQRAAPNPPPPCLPDVKTPSLAPRIAADELPQIVEARRAARAGAAARGASADQPLAIDFSRVWFDEPGDGRTWARGRTYKASFGAEGVTYVPFLGSDAPRNFPVRVSLLAATAGDTAIPVEAGDVSREGDSVSIDHGGIREVWHLTPDSAEQTFQIAARPASHGDVTLRLAVESELALRADGAGFALDGELGGVRIGRATAVDAGGARLDLAARLDGTSIAIELPAAFVASARYPLVVDPIYTTVALDDFGFPAANVDVAGGGFPGLFAACYEIAYSQTDSDVFTVDLHYGTPIPGSGDWIDVTTLSWFGPHIAYNGAQDTYLTTATVRSFAPGGTEIWCRARHAQTANEFPQMLVQNNAGGPVYNSDVGGDQTISSPSYFLAVWERSYSTSDIDIHAQLLDPFGARVGGVIYLENSGEYDSWPRVSKSVGTTSAWYQAWNITWERASSVDILGAQVAWDGFVLAPAFGISTSFLLDDIQACPSTFLDGPGGGPPVWMAAFTRLNGDGDIYVKILSGTTTIGQANLSALNGDVPGRLQAWPLVDTDGLRFVVTYSDLVPGNPAQSDAYVCTVGWAEGAVRVDEARVPIETGPESTYWTEIASGRTPSAPGFAFYALGWTTFLQGNQAAYSGTYYEPGTVETFCSGDGSYGSCPCGNTGDPGAGCANSVTFGAVLTPDGLSSVTYDSLTLSASSLPATSTCLFFQGTGESAPGTAFGDGLRCAGGSTRRIGSVTASGGIATYPGPGDTPISQRGSVPDGGAERTYQAWYRNAASFCTPATFNTTNGVRVRWLL